MNKHTITTNRSKIAVLSFLAAAMATGCLTEHETSLDDNVSPAELASDEQVTTTTQGLLGADACRNTDITITNSRTRDGEDTLLMIHRVEYYSASEHDWYTEDLANKLLFFDDSYTWWNEDLAHAENDTLTQWKIFYEYYEDGAWSPLSYRLINTPDDVCFADDNFSFTIE